MTLRTEFEFTLPKGYVDDEGTVHREGTMRLATAGDEILPAKDPRVQSNPAYLTCILLSRVVTRLGAVSDVSPHVVENLFVEDLGHLQDLYERVNTRGTNTVETTCPDCGETFDVAVDSPFEGTAHPAGDGDPAGAADATSADAAFDPAEPTAEPGPTGSTDSGDAPGPTLGTDGGAAPGNRERSGEP